MPRHSDDGEKQVTITYRDDGRGHGAIWDAFTINNGTGIQTFIAHDGGMKVSDFENAQQQKAFAIKPKPTVLEENRFGQGLLILPGESRKTPLKRPQDLQRRKVFEKKIVKDALLRGRPILAICGGGYHLQEFLGGRLIELVGHDRGANEPAYNLQLDKHGRVVGNIATHNVTIAGDSLLASMLKPGDRLAFETNSMHGLVVDDGGENTFVTTSTLSGVRLSTHQCINVRATKASDNHPMTLNNAEGFELFYQAPKGQAYAAPVIATQWHLEAYSKGESRHIIESMIEAGQTFDKKQLVLAELKSDFSKVKKALKMVGFFNSAPHTVTSGPDTHDVAKPNVNRV